MSIEFEISSLNNIFDAIRSYNTNPSDKPSIPAQDERVLSKIFNASITPKRIIIGFAHWAGLLGCLDA